VLFFPSVVLLLLLWCSVVLISWWWSCGWRGKCCWRRRPLGQVLKSMGISKLCACVGSFIKIKKKTKKKEWEKRILLIRPAAWLYLFSLRPEAKEATQKQADEPDQTLDKRPWGVWAIYGARGTALWQKQKTLI